LYQTFEFVAIHRRWTRNAAELRSARDFAARVGRSREWSLFIDVGEQRFDDLHSPNVNINASTRL
jgi:hypothetical protein